MIPVSNKKETVRVVLPDDGYIFDKVIIELERSGQNPVVSGLTVDVCYEPGKIISQYLINEFEEI